MCHTNISMIICVQKDDKPNCFDTIVFCDKRILEGGYFIDLERPKTQIPGFTRPGEICAWKKSAISRLFLTILMKPAGGLSSPALLVLVLCF